MSKSTELELDLAEAAVESADEVSVVKTAGIVPSGAAAAADAAKLQASVIALRKELEMSRRGLADEMGWTESRVWYLEQSGLRLDVDRNVADLQAELDKLNALKASGWSKLAVKKVPSKTAHADLQVAVNAAVAEAIIKTRDAHAADLKTMQIEIEVLLEEAKARKSTTKGYAALLETVKGMQWAAE